MSLGLEKLLVGRVWIDWWALRPWMGVGKKVLGIPYMLS